MDLVLSVDGEATSLRLSLTELDAVSRPLVSRLWPPLEDLAKDARMQLGGRSPNTLPAWSSLDRGTGGLMTASSSGSGVDETRPSERTASGRAFSVFPVSQGACENNTKYSAPPRRPTGVVLVGAATRMPSVLGFIRHVTGLEPAGGVDPELVVALGAAVHAGVLQVWEGLVSRTFAQPHNQPLCSRHRALRIHFPSLSRSGRFKRHRADGWELCRRVTSTVAGDAIRLAAITTTLFTISS